MSQRKRRGVHKRSDYLSDLYQNTTAGKILFKNMKRMLTGQSLFTLVTLIK